MNWKIFLAAGAILFIGTSYAQTPDGETPANEGVCDELMYATPGLYGLCIAYCEAQDLDDTDLDDPISVSKAVPKDQILANYEKKMRVGDPPMPCIQVPIPCWTDEEIARFATVASNDYFHTLRHQIYNCPTGYRQGETWYLEQQSPNAGIWAGIWYRTDKDPVEIGCWFVDRFAEPDIVRNFLMGSFDEYDAALDSILSANPGFGLWWTEYTLPSHCPQ